MSTKDSDYKKYVKRISNEKIPCYEPIIGKEEIINVNKVLKSNWISEGQNVRLFESKLSKICNRKYALSFVNATSAMIVAMKVLGIGRGDEVIVPSFTHCADPNAIAVTGAKPVFADVNKNTMLLDLKNIKKKITKKTKAILFVSLYGNMDEIEKIQNFCKKNKIFLLNDSAPALFSEYKNKPVASYGDCSFLSFFADKTITTGEGGMLLSNNKKIIDMANVYKHDGRKERGHDIILKQGYNFRFNEILAAIGLAQLKKYKKLIKRKIQIHKLYEKSFENIDKINLFKFNNNKIVPHRNIIFYHNAKKMIKYLSSNGVGVRTLFMPMHSQPAYRYNGNYDNSKYLYKTGICLPSAPTLKNNDILKIVKTINIFIKNENITS
tara:strand:+ start:2894 stop:4036 length:1143 start_codon:yes stop_codon:yes gene_type:complete